MSVRPARATLDKGVKVLVDGKQQTFKNQKGETIYPLFYRNSSICRFATSVS